MGRVKLQMADRIIHLSLRILRRDFKHINTGEAKIYLIEAAPRLLTMYDEDLSDYTKLALEGMGVTVKVNSPVKAIREGEIELEGETIRSANII